VTSRVFGNTRRSRIRDLMMLPLLKSPHEIAFSQFAQYIYMSAFVV
jgi:hypothetical protein